MRYSNILQRLVLVTDEKNLSVINPKTKKVELGIKNDVGGRIRDFRLLGKQDNRGVLITQDCHVILFSLGENQKEGIVDSFKIEKFEERKESGQSIAVSDNGEYVLVELQIWVDPHPCSRMFVFQVNGHSLVKKAILDLLSQGIGFKSALEFCGYAGSYIVWIGLSKQDNGPAQLYTYDTEGGELKELEDQRVNHQEFYPWRLHPLNGKYYFIGCNAQLMCLSLSNE